MADGAKTVADFLSRLETLRPLPAGGLRCFRGIRDSSWEFEPGLLRKERANLLRHERDAVRELISVRPTDFASDQTMFDRLVRMQHFELPTRLLDVTLSPLVALYFATEEQDLRLGPATEGEVTCLIVPPQRRKYFDSDTVSCVANLANLSNAEKSAMSKGTGITVDEFHEIPAVDRLWQFIRAEKPYFRPGIDRNELDRLWYVVPKQNNARIIAQSGAFMIFGLMPLQRKGRFPIKADEVLIDPSSKASIRKELMRLGIDQRNLFPEIDKAAAYIKERYA